MKIIAAIQARMNSTRFPGKVMADLCGKPVLRLVIEKAQKMIANKIYVLTSYNIENQVILDLCNTMDIGVVNCYPKKDTFCGFADLECLYWFYKLGITKDADYIIRICGDSPFICAGLANDLITEMADTKSIEKLVVMRNIEYLSYSVNGIPSILTQYGIFVEIIKVSALAAIMEHVTMSFYHQRRIFMSDIQMPVKYKLSIDYPADLEIARKVIQLNGGIMPESYKDIERIFIENPEMQVKENTQRYDWNNAY